MNFRSVRLLLAALLLLAPASALAQGRWLRAESPNFVIYTDADRATAERYASGLETFDQVLRARHGVAGDEKVRRKLPIYVLRRSSDLRKIRPGLPSAIRGFYAPTLDDTFAVALADSSGSDATLQHEYAHHFMLQRYPFGYPGWLIEGYAEYFATFRETPKYLEVGSVNENRAQWLSRGRWIPFSTLLKARPSDLKTNEERAMFYAQSWALTHWFLSDAPRAKQMEAYLAAVGRGVDSEAAMTQATGQTARDLDRVIPRYLEKGFPLKRFNLTARAAPPVTIAELPASASDVLLLTLRVKSDNGIDAPQDRNDGPVLLGEVRAGAARHPSDAMAQLALARAEVKLGDLSRAESLLQTRLAADPNDVETLQLLAFARLRAAEAASGAQAAKLRREATDFAGRAHKLDPDAYQTLVVYIRARQTTPRYPTDNDVNVLMDALDLAPQVEALRMNTAAALAARKRSEEAAAVLRPLAFNPHGGSTSLAAQAMLARLEAAGGAPPQESAAEAVKPAAASR